MVFLKVVLVGLASPRGLTVQCFPQEYFSPTPPFHFRCVGPYYGGIITGELLRRNYHVPSLGAYSAPQVLVIYLARCGNTGM